MGPMDEALARLRRRMAFRALTPDQRRAANLKALGQRDDLPVEALEHAARLAESLNEDGVPDLDKVPEESRAMLEKSLIRTGRHYLGGNTQGPHS